MITLHYAIIFIKGNNKAVIAQKKGQKRDQNG
jgi:hypothetical protein